MPEIGLSATAAPVEFAPKCVNYLESMNFRLSQVRLWRPGTTSLDPLTSFLDVREGRLEALGPLAVAPTRPADFPVREAPDRVIVPGLIDAHVHLELDPALKTPREQLAVPAERRVRAMTERAARMLVAGITTARDCGGGAHREHGLRDRIDAGEAVGPRLLCCGQPITTPGGHCDFWGGVVESRPDIARVVERQVEAGSDWIKVMATGGVFTSGSRARDAQFDRPTLAAIVEAAASGGRPVAAHCHGTEGIAHAVHAGVRTIEHASFAGPDGFGTSLDEALMREMSERSLWISPTVNVGWGRRIEDDRGEPTDFFRRMSGLLTKQRDHGLRFIASTDAGIPGVQHSDLVAGLLAFQRFAGLRPVDVLRAATEEAATALGIGDETGRLAVGLSADFLVLDRNPLDDLTALVDPEVVVFRGRWLDRSARAALREEAEWPSPAPAAPR